MVAEIIYIIFGLIIGIYMPHVMDLLHALRKRQFRRVRLGMSRTKMAYIFLLVLPVLLYGAFIYDNYQFDKEHDYQTEANNKMVEDITTIIIGEIHESNRLLLDEIHESYSLIYESNSQIINRLDRLIEITETDNVTAR